MKRIFVLIILFSLTVQQAFSTPLEDLVTAAQARQLRAGGDLIIETHMRDFNPKLWPNDDDLKQFVNRAKATIDPNIMVETLYLHKKPEKYHTSAENWDEKQRLQVFNQILAIGTMTGLKYYSESRDIMRTFYEYSFVIDGPTGKTAIPDPVLTYLPPTMFLHARQKDATFGETVYRYDYVTKNNALYFIQENITSLSIGIIPAIGRGNLRSIVSVYDCGDSVLIYAVSIAKTLSVPGVFWNRVVSSFSNRAEAILVWYTGRLDSELFIE